MTLTKELVGQYHAALPDSIRGYLNGRGITDAVIDRAELGWNGERITIPVYGRDGTLALFKLGKAPDDTSDTPKMLYYPAGAKVDLYGWDVLAAQPPFVIICEGEYDRLVLESHGFPAVTGTSGAAVFRDEWAAPIRMVPTIYVCFDNDDAGHDGIERVVALIPQARVVELPPEIGEGGDVTDFFVRLGKSGPDFMTLLEDAKPGSSELETSAQSSSRRSPAKRAADLERLKGSVRIEEVIAQYLTLQPSGGRALMGRCPFHEDREPSFAVYPDTQSFYCFGCKQHGDVIAFVMEAERLSFRETLQVLRRLAPRP